MKGTYNSTQRSATGISPHMMLTGHEKAMPLIFFYPEFEGKKTPPQVYVRDVIRSLWTIYVDEKLRKKKRFDSKAAKAKI